MEYTRRSLDDRMMQCFRLWLALELCVSLASMRVG
jgi:hypothetical protein